MKDVFYFKNISSVGGVESWLYYLSKKYEFEVQYKAADPEQIRRLSQNVECRKYTKPIKCDKFFCNYGLDIEVEAPIKKHIAHCDYKQVNFSPFIYPGFEYIGVSQLVCDSFKELTGKDIELIYNPVYIDIPKVEKYNDGKLHLISCTRLTNEKGLNRMIKLATLLDKSGIDYEWVIYTNRKRQQVGNKVIYKDHNLNILEEIAKADYLVQLSDCEAYCYSVVEALMVGTPVIVTDLPVFKELGLIHKKNAFICDMGMNNIDLDFIKQKSMKFTYKPPKDNWGKYLSTEKTYNPNELVNVRALRKIYLIEENIHLIRGGIAKVKKCRASYLEAKGLVEICY